jgi:lysyl-tRNA synthetase, class I
LGTFAPKAPVVARFAAIVGEPAKLTNRPSAHQLRCRDHGLIQPCQSLRHWFQALYETLLGSSQGPRMGSFIALYGIENSRRLIAEALQP